MNAQSKVALRMNAIQLRPILSGIFSLTRNSRWYSGTVARKALDQGETIRPTISQKRGGIFP